MENSNFMSSEELDSLLENIMKKMAQPNVEVEEYKQKILEGMSLMNYEILTIALVNFSANFHEFAAYYLDKNPTVTSLYESIGELVYYSIDAGLRGAFITTADNLEIPHDQIEALYAATKAKVADKENQTMQTLAEVVNQVNATEFFEMVLERRGPFSQYMQENPHKGGANATTENTPEN